MSGPLVALVVLLTVISPLALTAGEAAAQHTRRSAVTAIDLKHCKLLRKNPDGNAHLCPGLGQHKIYVAEEDLRFFVNAGLQPERGRGSLQTLRPVNTIFKGNSGRASIEWRLGRDLAQNPHALIVRYFTEHDGAKGQVLVVLKVSRGESCQVGMIDAESNENALELARQIADEKAFTFSCKDDPQVYGAVGKSPM